MKKVSKGVEPNLLRIYKQASPNNTWEQFKQSKARREQVQQQVRYDQGGLCAYCEIDLLPALVNTQTEGDFRIEHFHPKSDDSDPNKNWHLDWNNLLGCCHGGNQRYVSDGARFTSPDHSCDVPKGNKILDNVILNPLNIPAFPRLFKCDRVSGALSVDVQNCDVASISTVKAQATIDELHLDSNRLRRFRNAVLDDVNEQMIRYMRQGLSVDQALQLLAAALLRKNGNQEWPKFFTSIRHYLGEAGELQLQAIGFSG
ncbi:MAG: TIGR02646 family protein [Marinomonas sp.]|nr:TIGR02646 family protein [Marinomonas sp.]